MELAGDGITVNGIEPGYIRTKAMELLADEEGLAAMARYIPTGGMGVPEDIAYCMLYLASDQAGYITGQTHLYRRRLHPAREPGVSGGTRGHQRTGRCLHLRA